MFFATNSALVASFRPLRPTVEEALYDPRNRTRVLTSYDPDYLRYTYNDVLDCLHPVSELEALMRQCINPSQPISVGPGDQRAKRNQ